MANSKRVTVSIFLLHVFFAKAKACCTQTIDRNKVNVTCTCTDISDLRTELAKVSMDIRILNINETQIKELPANLLNVPVQQVFLWGNQNLSTIDPLAFGSGLSSSLKIFRLHKSPLCDRIWDLTQNLSEISNLELREVGLTKVPAQAFSNCKNLRDITLCKNDLTTFEAPLPQLDLLSLNLMNNQLSQESFPQNFFQHVTMRTLKLQDNPRLTQLEEAQFKCLLNNETEILVGRKETTGGEYMQCVGADWLCAKEGGEFVYLHNIKGYTCADKDYKGQDLLAYCKSQISGSL